jgi:type I restriction enzyme S subunit
VSWQTKKIGDILEIQNGYAFDSKLFSFENGKPLIRIRDIKNGIKTETNYIGDFDSKYIVKRGDFLIGMDGEFACYEWKGDDALLNQRVCRLHNFKDEISPKFLFYGINNYLKSIEDITTFTTVKHISSKQIANIEFPLPPLSIQEKIVSKLDAIFTEIDKASASAEANAKDAKKYIGKLIDETIHYRLENYTALTLNEITEVITCGVAKRPKYVESGIPFLSARNVKNGKMKWDRYEFVSLETHITLSKYNKPKVGDILYSRVGAGFGDAAIVDRDVEFSIFVSLTLIKVKPVVLNEFLCYYLNSPFIKEVASKNITGTGVGNLNVGAVRLFNIKLPDLKTQNEIVKKLNKISQHGEIFISSYFKKLEQLSLLKQSILRQAINGELVK